MPGQPAGEVPSAYAVLELSNVPSTEREVTRAYRLAAAKWHPDKWASAGEEERRESERRWVCPRVVGRRGQRQFTLGALHPYTQQIEPRAVQP